MCQDRFKQTQCPLGGFLDFRCAFLSIQATSHSSPVSGNKGSREQGEEQAQTPELLGEGSPHLCSVTAVGLGLSVSGVSMGTRPHSQGCASGLAALSSVICLFLFCALFNNPCFSFRGPSGEVAVRSRLAPGASRRAGLRVPWVSAVPSAGPSALL